MYLDHHSQEVREDWELVTVAAQEVAGRPAGLAWQWRGSRTADGFLYGRLDSTGQFTGDNITFLYPVQMIQ